MGIEEVKSKLAAAGLEIASESRTGNDAGWCIKLKSGTIVNCWDNGNTSLQGKNQQVARDALDLVIEQKGSATLSGNGGPGAPRSVFVVYGHDEKAKTELEAMLRRWNLEPLILDQLPSGGQTIIEKLESVRQQAQFAVILATPDDEGHRRDHADEKAYRARQNVVLELGMLLTLLGRPRVAILLKSDVQMERPSDIQGLLYIPFKSSLDEVRLTLAKEMNAQGIQIDLGKV